MRGKRGGGGQSKRGETMEDRRVKGLRGREWGMDWKLGVAVKEDDGTEEKESGRRMRDRVGRGWERLVGWG